MSAGITVRVIRALGLVAAMLALACMESTVGAAQSAHWIQFQDLQTGLSFRYPPELHPRRRDPQKFGLPKMETVVDLIGNTKLNPGTVVLRFLVRRGYVSLQEREKKLEELRRGCEKTNFVTVDGHKAVVCVSRGRAAVGWSVEILQPRECTIVTLLGGADYEQSLPPPHNGEFPLLSIIRTVHFAPANGTQIH